MKPPERTRVADLELTAPPGLPDGLEDYERLRVLVRLHGAPIGHVEVPVPSPASRLTPSGLREVVLDKLSHDVALHHLEDALERGLPENGLPPEALTTVPHPKTDANADGALPLVTVAVCTRDRADDLRLCLEGLAELDYPSLDVVIVDNASSTDDTERLVASYPWARYAREDRPGLDWARNRAIREARGEILAYTDDDVVVDPGWVSAIVRAFKDETVGAVTGLVVPYELETEAQVLFERYGGFGRGYRRRWWRMNLEGGEEAYGYLGAGQYGTGANMAYRTGIFELVGPFDEALDVGTVTNGGGDLEMFFRVLREGYTLAYEPSALVRHRHRREYERLRTQLTNNGIGFYSHLVRCALAYPDALPDALRLGLWWAWWWGLRRLAKTYLQPRFFPRELVTAELRGSLRGLSRYPVARARARALAAGSGGSITPLSPPRPSPRPARVRRYNREKVVGVRRVELLEPLDGLSDDDLKGCDEVRVYATFGGRPVGDLTVLNHRRPVGGARLRAQVVRQVGLAALGGRTGSGAPDLHEEVRKAVLQRYLLAGGGGSPLSADSGAEPLVSVVVATRDRPDDLRRCLGSLLGLRTRHPVEILVVDNNPASGLTSPVVSKFPGVRLVSEGRAGLSYARNKGFVESRGEIVVATDDDVVVPPGWLERLLAPFDRPDVAIVTGNVLPMELGTAAQRDFERYGALGRGYARKVADEGWFRSFKRQAVPTWELGATANAAFRAAIFADPEVGLLEESLGAGTPTGVGEDTYLFYKALEAGYSVAYEPTAYVWHKHRREDEALRRQIHAYSKGHVAYHLTTLLRDRDRRALRDLLARLPRWHAVNLARHFKRRLLRRERYPLRLILAEISGNLLGPLGLYRSLRRVEREGRSAPYLPPEERGAEGAKEGPED